MIRVLIADDHAIVRTGLAQLLGTASDLTVVGQARDGDEAVAMAGSLEPDIVLMDLSMPGVDGIEATRRLRAAQPAVRVLVLTSFADRSRILDALDAGADGYLLKHSEPEAILDGLRHVAAGSSPLDPLVARTVINAGRRRSATDLTEREHAVLTLLADGLTNRQIGRRLKITERTVKAHLTHVYQRLGVTDRTRAALWAQRHLDPARGPTDDP